MGLHWYWFDVNIEAKSTRYHRKWQKPQNLLTKRSYSGKSREENQEFCQNEHVPCDDHAELYPFGFDHLFLCPVAISAFSSFVCVVIAQIAAHRRNWTMRGQTSPRDSWLLLGWIVYSRSLKMARKPSLLLASLVMIQMSSEEPGRIHTKEWFPCGSQILCDRFLSQFAPNRRSVWNTY